MFTRRLGLDFRVQAEISFHREILAPDSAAYRQRMSLASVGDQQIEELEKEWASIFGRSHQKNSD